MTRAKEELSNVLVADEILLTIEAEEDTAAPSSNETVLSVFSMLPNTTDKRASVKIFKRQVRASLQKNDPIAETESEVCPVVITRY